MCGVLANNGCIYCPPSQFNRILKIDTINGTITILDVVLSIESSYDWTSGALAIDGCVYFMPYAARHILKLDPEDDSLSRVGGDLDDDEECKYVGTNGCWQ